MEFRVEHGPCPQVAADWLIVGVPEGGGSSPVLDGLDRAVGGALARLRERGDLVGKSGETTLLPDVPGLAAARLLLVGLGKPADLDGARLEKALRTAVRRVSEKKDVSVALVLPDPAPGVSSADAARIAAVAAHVGSIGQDLYRTEPGRHPLKSVVLVAPESAGADVRRGLETGDILGRSVNLARELVNRSPDEIHPSSVAEWAESESRDANLTCRVLDAACLKHERMNALLAVAQGSVQPPCVAIVEHRGAGPDAPVLALVGKGVTFDSGGLSLKPTDGMQTMKCDMAGAATVLGAMTAIGRLGIPANVVGYLGLVENMPSGSAYKLGDVLRARNGTTIEVLNTDAEGRLVLADVLSYAVDHGASKIVDLATLTGACVVALGEDVAGAFTNEQAWCDEVLSAAKTCGEDLWQMPMFDLYADLIKSDVADIKNIGGRWGGAVTAAKFLEKFVSGKPWVHLDIAGPSFASSNKPHREGGATGCFVRTLVELARRSAGT